MKFKKITGKVLAVFVAVMMVITSIPTVVFAVDTTAETTPATTEGEATAEATTNIGGDAYLFGGEPGIVPLEYTNMDGELYAYKLYDPVYLRATGEIGDEVTVSDETEVILSYTLTEPVSTFDIKTVGNFSKVELPIGTYSVKLNGVEKCQIKIKERNDVADVFIPHQDKIAEADANGKGDEIRRNTEPALGKTYANKGDLGCIETDKDIYTTNEDIHIGVYVNAAYSSGEVGPNNCWFGLFNSATDAQIGNYQRIMNSCETYEQAGITAQSYGMRGPDNSLNETAVFHLNSTGEDGGYGDGFFRNMWGINQTNTPLAPGKYEIRFYANGLTSGNDLPESSNPVNPEYLWGIKEIEVVNATVLDNDSTNDTGEFRTNKGVYNYGEDIIITGLNDNVTDTSDDTIVLVAPNNLNAENKIIDINNWYFKVKVTDNFPGYFCLTKKSVILQNCDYNADYGLGIYHLSPGNYKLVYYEADAWEACGTKRVLDIKIRENTYNDSANTIHTPNRWVSFGGGAYKVDNMNDGLANGQVAVELPPNYSSVTSARRICTDTVGVSNGYDVITEESVVAADKQTDCILYWGDANGKLADYSSFKKIPLDMDKSVTIADLVDRTIIPSGATRIIAEVRLNLIGLNHTTTEEQKIEYSIPLPQGITKFNESDYDTEFQVIGNTEIGGKDSNGSVLNGAQLTQAVNDNKNRGLTDGKYSNTLVMVGNIIDGDAGNEYAAGKYTNVGNIVHGENWEYTEDGQQFTGELNYDNVYATYGDNDRVDGEPAREYGIFATGKSAGNETEKIGGYSNSYHSHDYDSKADGSKDEWPYRLILMGTDKEHNISIADRNRLDAELEELRKTSNKPVFIFISDPIEGTVSGSIGDTDSSHLIDNHDADGSKNVWMNHFKNVLRKYENVFLFSGYNSDPTKTKLIYESDALALKAIDCSYHPYDEHNLHVGVSASPEVGDNLEALYTIPTLQVSSTRASYENYRYDQWGLSLSPNSHGYYVRVRNDGSFFLMCRDFTDKKYLPSACYYINLNNAEVKDNSGKVLEDNITISVNGTDDNSITLNVTEKDKTTGYADSTVSYLTNDVESFEKRVIYLDTDGSLPSSNDTETDEHSNDEGVYNSGTKCTIYPLQEGTAKVIVHIEATDTTVLTKQVFNIRVVKYGDTLVVKTVTDEDGNNLYERDDDDYTFNIKGTYQKAENVWQVSDNAFGQLFNTGEYVKNYVTTDEYYHAPLKYTVTLEDGSIESREAEYNAETGATFTLKGGEKATINNTILDDDYTITEILDNNKHVSSVVTKQNDGYAITPTNDGVKYSLNLGVLTEDNKKVEFINTLMPATVTLKYYDRTSVNGKPIDLNSTASTYTKNFYGSEIPHKDSVVDTANLLVKAGEALKAEKAEITNILDEYLIFTSQETAEQAIATEINPHTNTSYGVQEYHTNQYGYIQKDGFWENDRYDVADGEKWVEVSDDGLVVDAWMFNKPKKYNVKAYGVTSAEPTNLTTTSGGYYVTTDPSVAFDACYNQRPGGDTDTGNTVNNYLESYGIPGYVDEVIDTQKKITYDAEELKFLYWSYDADGKTVASTDLEYNYRIAGDTIVYAIYGDKDADPPKGVTALENATDYYSNGSTNYVRFNLVMNPYGYKDSYSIDGGYTDPNGITDVAVVYVRGDNNNATPADLRDALVSYVGSDSYDDSTSGTKSGTIKDCKFNALQYDIVPQGSTCSKYQTTLTNKNRVQFSTSFKSTNVQGHTFYAYVMMKVDGEWIVSNNAVTYMN